MVMDLFVLHEMLKRQKLAPRGWLSLWDGIVPASHDDLAIFSGVLPKYLYMTGRIDGIIMSRYTCDGSVQAIVRAYLLIDRDIKVYIRVCA